MTTATAQTASALPGALIPAPAKAQVGRDGRRLRRGLGGGLGDMLDMREQPLAHLVGGLEVRHAGRRVGEIVVVIDQPVDIGVERVGAPQSAQRDVAHRLAHLRGEEAAVIALGIELVRMRQILGPVGQDRRLVDELSALLTPGAASTANRKELR